MAYGVTSTGFVIKPLEVIEANIADRQRQSIRADLNNTAGSLLGQLNAVSAADLYELWQLLQAVWSARSPRGAAGASLDNIGAIRGTPRASARKATVSCQLTLGVSITVPAGKIVSENGNPNNRFVLRTAVTSTTAGTYTGIFDSETTGVHSANAGRLTVIDTPVTGWTAVTNALDVTTGTIVESDVDYRVRSDIALQERGSATVPALRAALLNHDAIASCIVRENTTDAVVSGMAPHSVQAVILTFASPIPYNEFAQLIFDNRAAGIQSIGAQSGTATDSEGFTHTMSFDLAAKRDVYVTIGITYWPEDYPDDGDVQLKTSLVASGNSLKIGADVVIAKLYPAIMAIAGVEDITSVTIGFAASPTGTVNLSVGDLEVGRFDTTRIVINKVVAT